MPFEFDIGVDVRLSIGDLHITADDIALLAGVQTAGSLNQATEELGRSYAHALRRLDAIETELGSLTHRHRGGASGGGMTLTDRGQTLLVTFREIDQLLATSAAAVDNRLIGTVTGHRGAFAFVETDSGTIRALAPGASGQVSLWVPPQAITIHPGDEPARVGPSSARNRLRGSINSIETETDLATVQIDCQRTDLSVTITHESLERLQIAAGDPVIAAFKATATRPIATTID